MALMIGFPFIVKKSGNIGAVWIQIRRCESVSAGIEIHVNSVLARNRIPIKGMPHAFTFLAPLYAQGIEVTLCFDGDLNIGDVIRQNNSGQPTLDFDGPSSTLAQYLVYVLSGSLLDDALERRVLVSGKCCALDEIFEIEPLGIKGKLQEKCDFFNDCDIWIHRDDFDTLKESTQKNPNIRPFLAANGRGDWLLEEFCQSYDLPLPGGIGVSSNDDAPNERNLFCRAIDPLFFVERDERLDQYFSKYPARSLLPLQTLALEDGNEGLYSSRNNPVVRHAFISGPTGCGKTTLMQSLVLNAMHNREGAAVYVGPVKALVEEFHWLILGDDFRHLLADRAAGRVFISTSDYVEHDKQIAKGEFALANMVYEKANILLSGPEGAAFADSLDLVVMDETHMLRDGSRGDVVDMLVTKIMRQNELRARGGRQPIQLVMISTENIAQELKSLPGFKNPCVTGRIRQNPIIMNEDGREPPFEHVLFRRVNGQLQKVKLCEFDSQLKRQLDQQQIEDLLNKVSKDLMAPEPNTGALSNALKRVGIASPNEAAYMGQFHTNILKFVNQLIDRHGHRSIIVVCNAISLCDSLAAGFANNYRNHRLDKHMVTEPFVRIVYDSEFEPEKRQRYVGWAEKGVYTHHSQMPAHLRSAVAEQFRMPIRANSRPQILFTTETLAYGVNLSASAIVLTDLEFLRTDPVNPVVLPSQEALSPNQYHNLLGRAGRKSFENEAIKSVAYIQIPDQWQAPSGALVRPKVYKFLKDYYGKQDMDPSQPLSTIAHREDFMTMENEAELKAYSYSIFRTVLECVRSAGGAGIRKQEALDIFRKTLGYMTANEPLQQSLAQLFERVLRLS